MEISNSEFINNSANSSAGAIYNQGNLTIDNNSKFSLNHAPTASAIYNEAILTVKNSEFMKNKANSTKLTLYYDKFDKAILIEYFVGDNYINAIYSTNKVIFENVTYFEYGFGSCNSDDVTPIRTDTKANQNIKLTVRDAEENVLDYIEITTDGSAEWAYPYDNPKLQYMDAVREDDDYYTEASAHYNYTWGEFDDLQSLVLATPENGVLNLERNFTYDLLLDTITKGVKVNRTITINGNGHTINALNMSRVFWTLADNVRFVNIHFVNATSWNGSFIYGVNVNNIEIIDCTFENAPIEEYISFFYDEPEDPIITPPEIPIVVGLSNSPGNTLEVPVLEPSNPREGLIQVVEDNYRFFGFSGGAVYIIGNNLSIVNSNFTNLLSDYGGAVYFNGDKATIRDSNFNATFALCGGALWLNGINIEVSNSNFGFALSELAGGAIYALGSNYTFDNINVKLAYALEEYDVYTYIPKEGFASRLPLVEINFVDDGTYGGGAIYVHADNVDVTDSSFVECDAYIGGAIYADGKNIVIKGSEFTYCGAEMGGAIFLHENSTGAVIDDCDFNSLMYFECGGAILDCADDVVIKNSRFYNVTQSMDAQNSHPLESGSITITGNDCKVLNCNFTKNNSTTSGSGVTFISNYDTTGMSMTIDEENAFNGLVDNCIFKDNIGGSIVWAGSNGTILNSKFYNNTAGELGTVSLVGDNLKIVHSEFVNNFAGMAGAVLLESTNTIIDDCLFDSNLGLEFGGAIMTMSFGAMGLDGDSLDSNITIKNSIFTNNSAYMGGAIFAMGSGTTIEDSLFEDNSGLVGGAVLWLQNDGRIVNSNFTRNSAILGGAISVGPIGIFEAVLYGELDHAVLDVPYFKNSSVVECNFINNTAEYAPGILWVDNDGLIEKSTFDGNHFEEMSLGHFVDLLTMFFSNVLGEDVEGVVSQSIGQIPFEIRKIIDGYFLQASGAAVYWIGENGVVNNTVFVNNDATTLPVMEYLQNVTFVFEKDLDKLSYIKSQTYFEYLKDKYYDEFMNSYSYEYYPGEYQIDIDLSHWLVDNVRGNVLIKFYNETSGEWSVKQFPFICYDNSTYDYWYTYYDFSTFPVGDFGEDDEETQDNPEETQDNPEETQDNPEETPSTPQPVKIFKGWGQIYVIWSEYYGSPTDAPSSAGAIYWKGQNGLINNSEFINNTADDAGAVFICADDNDEATCAVDNSKFINNTAKNGGGAIVLNGANGNVNNSEFTGNKVVQDSNDYEWWEYISSTGGGAILWIGPNGVIDKSNFTNNTAENGGAIVAYGLNMFGEIFSFSDNLLISNSRFDENTAEYGGAIDWVSYNAVILNSTFNKNHASYGGAVLFELSGIHVEGNFTNNIASEGGALLILGNDAQITKSIFKSNNADIGGAIAIDGNNTSMSYVEFINNTALQGGAIYWSDNGGSITHAKFFNNTATRGGAIYYDGKSLTLRDAEFQFNKAETGSAIYASDSGLSIISSTFLDNQAKASALTVTTTADGSSVVVSAVFTGNDNLINAIYALGTCNLNDVTYWAENGLANSNTANPGITDLEAGINITLELYDSTFKPITVINVTNVNGQATIAVPNVKNGRYFIVVKHSEDAYYTEVSNSDMIQVGRLDAPIDLSVHDIFYKENATINVQLPFDATGNVTFEIDGVNYTCENLTNAFASANKSGLVGGVHNVTVYYSGDETYLKNSTSATFTVKPIPSTIIVKCDGGNYKEGIPVNVTVGPSEVTGMVILTIQEEFGATLIINGTVDLQDIVSILNAGTYNITAYYVGDNNYLPSSNKTTFTVKPIDLNPVVSAANVTILENATFDIIVPDDFEGKVNVTVGETSKVYHIAGPTQVTFVNLPLGNKTAEFAFYDDNNYNDASLNTTFAVNNVTSSDNGGNGSISYVNGSGEHWEILSIKSDNMTRGYNSPYDYEAEFLDMEGNALKHVTVTFKVNGKEYSAITNDAGIAQLTSSKLPVGKYNITSVNPITKEEVTNTVEIVKRITGNKDLVMDYLDGSVFKVKVYGDDGNMAPEGEIIDITANGVHYVAKVDNKGYASLKINLLPKKYTIAALYKGFKTTNKLTVKQTLKAVKKTISVKKGKKITIKATLKWSNGNGIKGKVIKFKFKGKTYKAKTNKKGLAKVVIKNKKVLKKLKKGKKYTVKIIYAVKYKYGNGYQTVNDVVKCKVKIK